MHNSKFLSCALFCTCLLLVALLLLFLPFKIERAANDEYAQALTSITPSTPKVCRAMTTNALLDPNTIMAEAGKTQSEQRFFYYNKALGETYILEAKCYYIIDGGGATSASLK